MRVHWLVDGLDDASSSLASNRYRVQAPAQHLGDQGVDVRLLAAQGWRSGDSIGEADLVLVGKLVPGRVPAEFERLAREVLQGLDEVRAAGVRVVADFNDYHFDKPAPLGPYWRRLATQADLLVAGSPAMRDVLERYSTRPIEVIGDPVLSDRHAPRHYGNLGMGAKLKALWQSAANAPRLKLLWFGNLNNWPALKPWAQAIAPLGKSFRWTLHVVTQPNADVAAFIDGFNRAHAPGAQMVFVPWSAQAQAELLAQTHVVLLPSEVQSVAKAVKTANRLTDALQAGCHVIASPLPSYQPFAQWCALTDQPLLALREYLRDPGAAIAHVKAGQEALKDTCLPAAIGQRWQAALRRVRELEPAGPVLPIDASSKPIERIVVLAQQYSMTQQVRFNAAFKEDLGARRMTITTLTELELLRRFGGDGSGPAAWAWLRGQLEQARPQRLLFIRYSGPHVDAMLAWAREAGVPTLLHLDDDLLNVPNTMDAVKAAMHRHPPRMAALRQLLAEVDLVHCVSEVLAHRLRAGEAASRPIRVSGAVSVARSTRGPGDGPARVIGYMGARDHNADLAAIAPALAEVLAQRPQARLALFGELALPAELQGFAERVECHDGVYDFDLFQQRFDRMSWDIGLCPLLPQPFNLAKTPVKWIEYTGIGAAVVASANTVYDAVCADGRGILVEPDREAWVSAILRLLDDDAYRVSTVRAAQQYMEQHFSRNGVRADLLAVFDEAARCHAERHGTHAVSPPLPLAAPADTATPQVRLNLGCGDKILPGYLNVDVVAARGGKSPDVLCDLRDLAPFDNDSVDEVLSVHVVEHFWRWEVLDVLKEWCRVLKPGGQMIIECPNLRAACEAFLAEGDAAGAPGEAGRRSMWVFYGDPNWQDPLMVHRWGYTPQSLAALLREVGLVDVRQEPAQFKLREPRDMRVVGRKPKGSVAL